MSTLPLVTIIVPCFNHEKYIQLCIESIINQTYPEIELLVIDDGSSDASPSILKKLSEQYSFDLVLQKNKGVSVTLNEAIARAKGKYICPIGSDDIMMLDKTEKQVSLMEADTNIAVCGGNALMIDSDNIIYNKKQKFPLSREVTFDNLFRHTGVGIVTPTAMMRKSVVINEGCYDPSIPVEDLYMWLKLTHRGHRMVRMNEVLIYYRKHANNTYKNVDLMINSILKILQPYQNEEGFEQVKQDYLRSAFLNAVKQKQKLLARDLLKKMSWSQRLSSNVISGVFKILL
ncbi:MAG: glycosyltransferase [Oleispira sp.]|nr:glycosyltransferase [Oleispira sp.]MBL4880444.1 glycosyltransferase [Oleispira sp.]